MTTRDDNHALALEIIEAKNAEIRALTQRAEAAEAERDQERRARLVLMNALTTLRDHLPIAVGDADFAEASEAQADAAVEKAIAILDAARTGAR